MKKAILFLGFLFIISVAISQVGIGTITPDASSILDLSATDKGVLIPQVSLSDVTDTMLDGVNMAATGLLIYNTNSIVTGGNGVGFYYFNGTTWERLTTVDTDDIDWYKVGTTVAPSSINDSIYTQGNLAIGKTTADYKLDVNESNSDALRTFNIASTNATTTRSSAIYNEVNYTGTDTISAAYNLVNGNGDGLVIGTSNDLQNTGNGRHFGTYNKLNGLGTGTYQYGVYNELVVKSTSGSSHKGVYNNIYGDGGFAATGMDNRISLTSDASSLGIRNNLYSIGSGSKIGVLTQVDGGTGDKYGVANGLRSNGDNEARGIWNHLYGVGNGDMFGVNNEITNSGSGTHYGVYTELSGTATGVQYGSYNNISNSGGTLLFGNYNLISGTNPNSIEGTTNYITNTGDGNHYGSFNELDGSGNGEQTGLRSNIGNSGSGTHYGVYTDLTGDGDGNRHGTYNSIDNSGTGDSHGNYNSLGGTSNGNQFGSYNIVSNTGNGYQYGTYNRIYGGGQGQQVGTFNIIQGGTVNAGWRVGVYSAISGTTSNANYGNYVTMNSNAGSGQTGSYNRLAGSSGGSQIGVFNDITNSGGSNNTHYGTLNRLSGGGDGIMYATYNQLDQFVSGTGDKYGSWNYMYLGAGGTHYGVYSEALKVGSFAGYFLGNVSIGTTGGNSYILPVSRGTANQVIQTDGGGNLGWVDTSTIGDDLGNHGATTTLDMNSNAINEVLQVSTLSVDSYDKLRVWGNANYTIGMNSGMTYGFLNGYAMTFTMNSDADRGWIWRDISDAQSDGAMSLTTNGRMTLKSDLRVDTSTLTVDATNDRVGVRTITPSFDLNVKQSSVSEAGSGGLGLTSSTNANNWKVYHSGAHLSFAENGVRRAYVTAGTGAFVATSDKRLKKKIVLSGEVLAKLRDLNAYTYLYKDQANSAKKTLGFMAQDILPIFPELVETNENGYLGLNYSGFGVIAIKAIQEQQKVIEKQNSEIDQLKSEMAEMKSLVTQIVRRSN